MLDDGERKRLVSIIFLLADALVLSNFLAFHAFTDPKRLTLSVTIISWAIFIGALIGVNVWLYYVYLKKPENQDRPLS